LSALGLSLDVTAGPAFVVMGATGGVGGYAVQMARSRGGVTRHARMLLPLVASVETK
jgi:NADPH:quinone reductase-like Zn-dependent oxidoreductase